MSQNAKAEQLTLFSLDTCAGKMCLGSLAAESRPATTSASSSKKQQELRKVEFLYLDLRPGYGSLLGPSWELNSPSLGAYWTHNFGPAPLKGAAGSSLSQILVDNPHPKYYLSKNACLGILRRAKARGKELPPQLKAALEIQAGLVEYTHTIEDAGTQAFSCNQRDEASNLNDVAGALQAQPGMKQQTFISQLVAAGVVTKGNGDCFLTPETHTSLTAGGGQAGQGYPCVLTAGFCAGAAPTAGGIGYQEECAPTLKAGSSGTNMVPSVLCLNDQGGQRMDVFTDQTGTLRAQMDGHPPLVLADETYCIAGNAIDREPQNGGNGLGCQVGISYTLTGSDHHAICSRQPATYQNTVGTIGYSDHKGINNQYVNDDKCIIMAPNLIRRLVPTECERLMGFPDGWTDLPGGSDSARYKSLGNSVSIPCVEFLMHRIASFLRKMNGGM